MTKRIKTSRKTGVYLKLHHLLHDQLQQFGLDPEDWTVVQIRSLKKNSKVLEVNLNHSHDNVQLTGLAIEQDITSGVRTAYWKNLTLNPI